MLCSYVGLTVKVAGPALPHLSSLLSKRPLYRLASPSPCRPAFVARVGLDITCTLAPMYRRGRGASSVRCVTHAHQETGPTGLRRPCQSGWPAAVAQGIRAGLPLQQGARDDDVSRHRRERHECRYADRWTSCDGRRLWRRSRVWPEASTRRGGLLGERPRTCADGARQRRHGKGNEDGVPLGPLRVVRRWFTDSGNGLAAGSSPSPRRCLRGSGTRREDYRGP